MADRTQTAVLDSIAQPQTMALHSIERVNSAFVQGMRAWSNEVTQFVAGRIEEDLKAQQELLRCQNLDDVREVQTRFISQAIDQYTRETSHLLKLGGEVFSKTVQPGRDQ